MTKIVGVLMMFWSALCPHPNCQLGPWLVIYELNIAAGHMKWCSEGSQIRPEGSQIIRILTRKIAKISGWAGNFGNSRNFRFNRKFSLHGSTWSGQSPMVQRAIAVMPALKTSQKLARNSQHIQSAQGIKMLFSTHISPTILVIISGIWQELEIKILHLFDLVKRYVKGPLPWTKKRQ